MKEMHQHGIVGFDRRFARARSNNNATWWKSINMKRRKR